MSLSLFGYEEISGKHFVKLARLINETQVKTETVLLTDILSGKIKADNVQLTSGGLIIDNKKVTSTEQLLDVLSHIKAIQIGVDSNNKPIMINSTGILITSPKVQQPVQQPIQQPNQQQSADIAKINELTDKLNKARDYYYNTGTEMMSNFEYDSLVDELAALEKKTGYSRQDSPNKNVGANVKSAGPTVAANANLKQGTKVAHEEDALSLDKTKDVADLIKLLNDKTGVLSVKMDGLTIVLTYENGQLQYAVTRGNGHIGEIVTENAKNMIGVPLTIGYKEKLVIRGEAYMTYSSFNQVNSSLPEGVEPYKNPRNLAAGTIRTFDKPKIVKNRQLRFCAFEIVNWEEIGLTSVSQMLSGLEKLGFTDTIKRVRVNAASIKDTVEQFTAAIKASDLPADGLVLRLDDLEYGKSLGTTGKFPRHSIAFKWEDAEVETELVRIDWTVGRTGIITPTAVFKPVDIEGSTIQRASLHNLSMMTQLLGRPYKGQKIWVYKANLIIPQVARAEKITDLQSNSPTLSNSPALSNSPTEKSIDIDGLIASIKNNLLLKEDYSSWFDDTGSSRHYTLNVNKSDNDKEITVKIDYDDFDSGHNYGAKTEAAITVTLNIDNASATCTKKEGTRHSLFDRYDRYGNSIPESKKDTLENISADDFSSYCKDNSSIKNLNDLLTHCNTFLKG